MMGIHQLRGFQRDLLFVVYGLEHPNGQEILEEMNDSLTEDVQAGRVYSNLDDLVEVDLVRKTRTDGRENRYELTIEGVETIESLHEWEREFIRNARNL